MKNVMTVTVNPSMDRTLRVNELLVGDVNRIGDPMDEPAGKGINVSKVLQIFGISTTLVGFLGGYVGKEIQRLLEADMGGTAFTSCGETTRMNIKIQGPGQVTEFNSAGPHITAGELDAFFLALQRRLPNTEYLILSGSIPPGVPSDIYATMTRMARQANPRVFVCLDTSGDPLIHGLAARPDMIKPNIHELQQYTGRPLADYPAAAKALQGVAAAGIEHALCSLGPDGLLTTTKDGVVRLFAPGIEAIQTVGCGDSVVAAYIWGLLEGRPKLQCAAMAVAAGTAAAGHPGIGLQDRRHFEDVLPAAEWEAIPTD